ncbi:PREDICTED: innexin inx2-like [Nicrophorus vespilloides]|uniref:Innexin n=1 Tax=Nicrophorus vespilloides TaxID=110193 RepID=A0ABM1N6C0_NICVS|nr:PREDICTED: innexin inx2-like [Nicrophorus vespilloides]
MIDFLNSFKSLIKLEKIHTDNNIFKLHYKFTVILLILFSILLTSKQYFGDPIDCDVETRKSVIDTYCWIYGTFVIKRTLNEEILSGLGNYVGEKATPYWQRVLSYRDNEEIITQKYYQWVCIVFCFQALLFYIPRYLWKSWEAGRLRLIVKDLGGPLVSQNWNGENKERLISYILCGKYSHNCYTLRFAFCEVLNFVNVLFQIVLMDWFLTGQFTGYGIGVATYHNVNPMTAVFPKITKCTYYRYGPSGSLEARDALCVLPLNIVNEKLFLFLWFWFAALTLLSFYQLIYRAVVLVSPKCRSKLLRARCRYLSEKHSDAITKRLTFGDMFFMDQLGKNMNPIIFKELVQGVGLSLVDEKSLYNPEITIAL